MPGAAEHKKLEATPIPQQLMLRLVFIPGTFFSMAEQIAVA
jgi:hypothetical protein